TCAGTTAWLKCVPVQSGLLRRPYAAVLWKLYFPKPIIQTKQCATGSLAANTKSGLLWHMANRRPKKLRPRTGLQPQLPSSLPTAGWQQSPNLRCKTLQRNLQARLTSLRNGKARSAANQRQRPHMIIKPNLSLLRQFKRLITARQLLKQLKRSGFTWATSWANKPVGQ